MNSSDNSPPNAEAAWLGPVAYAEGDAVFFKGRSAETAELHRLIHSEPMCLLYGDSGLGKTSLLQAGVFPLLRGEGWLPVRIRLDQRCMDEDDCPLPPLSAQVLSALSKTAKTASIALPDWNERSDTLAAALGDGGVRIRNNNVVLVFDQFEECWTLTQDHPEARHRVGSLLDQIAELFRKSINAERDGGAQRGAKDSPSLRIIFTVREHPSADVRRLESRFPALQRARLLLSPFSSSQVREIVEQPDEQNFDQSATDAIVKTFARDHDAQTALVDPTQLSVFCLLLIRRQRKYGAAKPISALFVDGTREGMTGGFIRKFYDRIMAELPDEFAAPARCLIENSLVDAAGYRRSACAKSLEEKFGITPMALQLLVDGRLLQYVHWQPEQAHVELVHDRVAIEVAQQRTRRTLHAAKVREHAAELSHLVAAIAYRERAESSEQEIEILRQESGDRGTVIPQPVEISPAEPVQSHRSRRFIVPALCVLCSVLLTLLFRAKNQTSHRRNWKRRTKKLRQQSSP